MNSNTDRYKCSSKFAEDVHYLARHNGTLEHNNATAYVTEIVNALLEEHEEELTVLLLSLNSPNVNLIEHT